MSKFKKGDKVRVRKDLVPGEKYGCATFIEDMMPMRGKTVTIENVFDSGWYHIKEGNGSYTDEMLEPLPLTIYASDLISEVRKNPEKYEGKKYQVVDGLAIDYNGKIHEQAQFIDGQLIDDGYVLYVSDRTQLLEKIKPEPQPVDVMNAMIAHHFKRAVKCVLRGKEHIYTPNHGLMKDQNSQAVTSEQLINGTWFIIKEN